MTHLCVKSDNRGGYFLALFWKGPLLKGQFTRAPSRFRLLVFLGVFSAAASSEPASVTLCDCFSIPKCCDDDLPGVHPTEWGQRWGEIQLEHVAVQPTGGHQAGGPCLVPLHACQREAWPATATIRTSSVQPDNLQGSSQPPLVSLDNLHYFLPFLCIIIEF